MSSTGVRNGNYCCCCCCWCDDIESGRGAGWVTSREIHGIGGGRDSIAFAAAGPTRTDTESSLRTALAPLKTPRVGGTSA